MGHHEDCQNGDHASCRNGALHVITRQVFINPDPVDWSVDLQAQWQAYRRAQEQLGEPVGDPDDWIGDRLCREIDTAAQRFINRYGSAFLTPATGHAPPPE